VTHEVTEERCKGGYGFIGDCMSIVNPRGVRGKEGDLILSDPIQRSMSRICNLRRRERRKREREGGRERHIRCGDGDGGADPMESMTQWRR
jgi:hypothetical protein